VTAEAARGSPRLRGPPRPPHRPRRSAGLQACQRRRARQPWRAALHS